MSNYLCVPRQNSNAQVNLFLGRVLKKILKQFCFMLWYNLVHFLVFQYCLLRKVLTSVSYIRNNIPSRFYNLNSLPLVFCLNLSCMGLKREQILPVLNINPSKRTHIYVIILQEQSKQTFNKSTFSTLNFDPFDKNFKRID